MPSASEPILLATYISKIEHAILVINEVNINIMLFIKNVLAFFKSFHLTKYMKLK